MVASKCRHFCSFLFYLFFFFLLLLIHLFIYLFNYLFIHLFLCFALYSINCFIFIFWTSSLNFLQAKSDQNRIFFVWKKQDIWVSFLKSATVVRIFSNSLIFYQMFPSPHVKKNVTISNKICIHKLPKELQNVSITFLRKVVYYFP